MQKYTVLVDNLEFLDGPRQIGDVVELEDDVAGSLVLDGKLAQVLDDATVTPAEETTPDDADIPPAIETPLAEFAASQAEPAEGESVNTTPVIDAPTAPEETATPAVAPAPAVKSGWVGGHTI